MVAPQRFIWRLRGNSKRGEIGRRGPEGGRTGITIKNTVKVGAHVAGRNCRFDSCRFDDGRTESRKRARAIDGRGRRRRQAGHLEIGSKSRDLLGAGESPALFLNWRGPWQTVEKKYR